MAKIKTRTMSTTVKAEQRAEKNQREARRVTVCARNRLTNGVRT